MNSLGCFKRRSFFSQMGVVTNIFPQLDFQGFRKKNGEKPLICVQITMGASWAPYE